MNILIPLNLILLVLGIKSQESISFPQNGLVGQSWYPQALQQPIQNGIPYYSFIPQQQSMYYPGNYPSYYAANYPTNYPTNYPANYPYNTLNPEQNQPLEPIQLPGQHNKTDPFANVPTEIIDVNPEYFNKIMERLHEQPQIISYENRVTKGRIRQPHYTVKTETKQSNKTSIPSSIQKHQVTSKTYSFNKTYVFHPGQEKENVINLNFINGVQVTDAPENLEQDVAETTTSGAKAESTSKKGKKFIDVPEGCEEGRGFSITGGCFSEFALRLNTTNNSESNSHNRKSSSVQTPKSRIQSNRHYGTNN